MKSRKCKCGEDLKSINVKYCGASCPEEKKIEICIINNCPQYRDRGSKLCKIHWKKYHSTDYNFWGYVCSLSEEN